MNERIFLSGYLMLLATTVTGIVRYKHYDSAIRIVLLLFGISLLSELMAYIAVKEDEILFKSIVYNVYSVIEVILVTSFFLKKIKPFHYWKLLVSSIVAWPVLCVLNLLFLQPSDSLNTNFLMVESFSIITMCLYFIYWLLKKNVTKNIFLYPHFWIAVLWLVFWSGTFFFWAFIKILNSYHWPYLHEAITAQGVLLLMTYIGFFLVVLLHPKKTNTVENY